MSALNILQFDEKDSMKKVNLYDQVAVPTRVSDDILFSLLASFTTESFDQILKTLNSVIEYSDRLEKTDKNLVIPNAFVDAQYKTALEKYHKGVTSFAPREPRVSFFYHNDHETERESEKKGSAKQVSADKGQTSKKVQRPHNPRDRRRVVSYVWVDTSDTSAPGNLTNPTNPAPRKGIVYYGGSVYNPTPTVRGVLKRLIEKRITSKEQLMNAIRSMKTEYSSPSNYNRMGEKQTALGRLSQRPIVFETSASTHQQVREEIKRLMFSRGVFGKRVTDEVAKKKKD